MAVCVLDLLGVDGCSDCRIDAWLGIDNLGALYLDLELLVEGRAVVVNGSGSVGVLIGRFPFDELATSSSAPRAMAWVMMTSNAQPTKR